MKAPFCHTAALLSLLALADVFSASGQVSENLKTIEDQFVVALQLHVEKEHQSKLAALNANYVAALEKAFQLASKGDRLKEALALKEEMTIIQEKRPLPQNDAGLQPALVKLRSAYRAQYAKLMTDRTKAAAPIVKKFDEALAALQTSLTKAGKVEDAASVCAYREAGPANRLLGTTGTVGVAEISAPASDTSSLTIIEAKCGADRSWRDVTQIVQSMVSHNRLTVNWQQPYKEIGGDPAYGEAKVLTITYRLNGKVKTSTYREENSPIGLRATIP
jgi:hypothetical protein